MTRTVELPLSRAQVRFWLGAQLNGSGRILVAYDLRGPLDVRALSRAVDDVIDRHETLRCAYAMGDADLVRTPVAPPRLLVTDVPPGGDADTAVGQLDDLVRLDAVTGRVFQPVLVRVAPQRHVFGLGVHHIAFDGRSEAILLRDLSTAYRARLGNDRPAWPAAARYSEFVTWELAALAAPGYREHVGHWRESMAGPPVTTVAAAALGDRADNGSAPTVGGAEYVLDPARTEAYLCRARAARCSPGTYLLAVHLRVLTASAGVADLAIGCELSLRHLFRPAVVGPVINTVPLRSPATPGDPTGVRDQILAAMAHAQVPAEEIGMVVAGGRSRSEAQFDYLAVHESYGEPAPALPDVSARRTVLPQREPAVPLVVTSAVTGDRRLRLRAAYRLSPSAATRVPDHLSSIASVASGEGTSDAIRPP